MASTRAAARPAESAVSYTHLDVYKRQTYANTISSDALLAKVKANTTANDTNITLGSGITAATVKFTAGVSTDTYVDAKDAFLSLIHI